MDSRGFDTVARTIAGSGSRRSLMRALVGTVTMLALSRRASRVAAQGDPGAPGICLTTNACYFSMASFNAEGDQCAIAAPNACADGLFCCGSGDVGTCQTAANC